CFPISMCRLPHHTTLFPYTTLFRSIKIGGDIVHAILFSNYGDFLYATRNDGCLFRVNLSTKTVDKLIEGHQSLYGMYEDSKGNLDRKSTRLNSSHVKISYAVFCLKK